jgi:hypothetical protein
VRACVRESAQSNPELAKKYPLAIISPPNRHFLNSSFANGASFAARYDALTTACNNCHQAMNVGFNRLQVPEANPFPNQVFAVPQPDLATNGR